MRLRLHHRIALPFVAVAVAATAAATFFTVRGARRWVNDRRYEDAASTAELLRRREYAINPALLRIAADLTHVEVVTFRSDGEVVASTFPSALPADLQATLLSAVRPRTTFCGESCYIAYEEVMGEPDLTVAVIAGLGAADPLTESTVNSIWLGGLVGVFLLVGTSEVLALKVTARVQRLVDFTKAASSETSLRTDEGRDEIGRLGAAFNAMLDRLADKNRALMRSEKLAVAGMMAARVAHDVRNPLSSIKMQIQLLAAQTPPASEDGIVLAAVLRDINQLESVVHDLLETARPEAPALRPVTLVDLVQASVTPLRAQLAHRRITLTLQLETGAPPMHLDPGRIRRAIVNVLTNAAEATRAGGAIWVATRTEGHDQIIEVADDGVGVDPSLIDRVFDPFVSTKTDGVGLGLVNTKAIVESHGGRVTLASRSPHGTLMTIHLPQRTEHG